MTDSFETIFFSSKRRHTRCSRDWSSDVCSSDLCRGNTAPWGRLSASGAASLCANGRSEEHTSELQSRLHLVCRLLLEKKKAEAKGPGPGGSVVHRLAPGISPSSRTAAVLLAQRE